MPNDPALKKGIYCDCFGTLYRPRMGDNHLLVRYLNAQYAAGTPVVIFSTEPADVSQRIQALGLHDDWKIVQSKKDYDGVTLETLIDDHPSHYLKALKHWSPDDPLFRAHIKTFLTAKPPFHPSP